MGHRGLPFPQAAIDHPGASRKEVNPTGLKAYLTPLRSNVFKTFST